MSTEKSKTTETAMTADPLLANVCKGCKINYWNCKYNDYEEDWDGEEEYRYYNCSHPDGNGNCDKENKCNDDEDYCELAEHY